MPRIHWGALTDSRRLRQDFPDAGFVALTFDYRGYGGSEGIRRRLIPMEQIDDIRNAMSFFETLPDSGFVVVCYRENLKVLKVVVEP